MSGADEADFLELLVANNRIGDWVDRIRARGSPARQKQALLLLKQAVESRSAYAEEARQAGVVPLLTRLLGLTGSPPEDPILAEDEEVLDTCSAIIAACSGPMATAGKVSTFTYDNAVVHIREGALGDGLGAKVWMVAHMLCLELASNRKLVAGHRVLELGSGCGVCGLAVAALGAGHVVLSDVEGPVLRNLRACMHLNYRAWGRTAPVMAATDVDCCGTGGVERRDMPAVEAAAQWGRACDTTARGPALPSDSELFDEAEEMEDLDEVKDEVMAVDGGGGSDGRGSHRSALPAVASTGTMSASTAATAIAYGNHENKQQQQPCVGGGAAETAWEVGNTSVRLLDWAESRSLLDSGSMLEELRPQSAAVVAAAEEGCCGGGGSSVAVADMPPRVPVWERFPVVIGSEVMYERVHAELVAAVLKHRLAPGGCAVLQCAVRELKVFEHFVRECQRRGLRYRHRQVDPATVFNSGALGSSGGVGGVGGGVCPFEGILGRADEYEGGVRLMAVDHEDSPCGDWYRDDWEGF